jgi:hypothetical protein
VRLLQDVVRDFDANRIGSIHIDHQIEVG